YPEGGGQPCDRGVLDGEAVVEVAEEGEVVVHLLASAAAAGWTPGREVAGEVDLARRQDHAQQHSGQHLLSALLLREGIETLSFHLGAEESTIDVASERLDAALVAAVERAVNARIRDCLPVTAERHPPAAAAAAAAALRKPPEEKALLSPRGLRVVRIGGPEAVDTDACCGTHVGSTGELGLLLVLGWERGRKGQTRVRFVAGERALRAVRARLDALGAACAALTTGHEELPARVSGLLEQSKDLGKRLERYEQEAARQEGERLARAGGPLRRVARWEGAASALGALARGYLEATPEGVIVCAHAGERLSLVVARGEAAAASACDPAAWVRELLTPLGGRGGGKGATAQGSAPDAGRLEDLLRAARALCGEAE
ncbi:MAG: DHHA1 domain-containing protein, partial [Planctomycetota bacterium]